MAQGQPGQMLVRPYLNEPAGHMVVIPATQKVEVEEL
jgi:hypothetical protein